MYKKLFSGLLTTILLFSYTTVFAQCEEFSYTNSENPFSDVSEFDKNYDAIMYLYETNIIQGYDDGTYKPINYVNRAELLKILIEGEGLLPDNFDEYEYSTHHHTF